MAAVLLCLLAFVLRVHTLSFESLDIDEADIVAFARLPLDDLARRLVQPGENGPLYVILLRGWGALAGESEFALRYFSVVPSVLSIAVIGVLGRRLLSATAGLVAAGFLAVSTYELYFAQMVKMYSLVLLLVLLSCWLLLRAIERSTPGRWAAYTAATTLAMHVHVFGALLVPWHVAFVSALWLRHRVGYALPRFRQPPTVTSPAGPGAVYAGDGAAAGAPVGEVMLDGRPQSVKTGPQGGDPEGRRAAGVRTSETDAAGQEVAGSAAPTPRGRGAEGHQGGPAPLFQRERRAGPPAPAAQEVPDGVSGRWWYPVAALAVLVLPYVPLGLARLGALREPETLTRQFTGPRDALGMVARLAREYGTRFDQLPGDLLTGAFLALTLAGFAAIALRRRQHVLLFLGLGIALPVGLSYLFVALGAPLFSSRYLILTLPVFYLLWAGLIARVWGWAPLVAMGMVSLFVVVNGARWWQTAIQGQHFREDWRAAVAYLERQHEPGQPVVVLHDASFRAVDYYRTEPMILVSLERGPEQPPDLSRVPSFEGQRRAWLLAAYFEAGDLTPVELWLNERGHLASKAWLPGVMVSEYRVAQ